MSVNLYKHNEGAYNSILEMLKINGKAAIIHPTGTGKSFIGFKLCEDFPDKTVCRLSPSDYIFKTQIENLKNASGGYEPKNVKFFYICKAKSKAARDAGEKYPNSLLKDKIDRLNSVGMI